MHPQELQVDELVKYKHHLKSLDSSSKYLRFTGTVSDYSIDQFVDSLVGGRHKIFAIFDRNGDVIAASQVSIDKPVELAFSVLTGHRGRGYCDALMKHCIAWCITNDIEQVQMTCLKQNSIIRHLAVKHGMQIVTSGGETTATVDLTAVVHSLK